jgi:hypothetical protein
MINTDSLPGIVDENVFQPFEAEERLNNIKNSVRTSKRTQHFTITEIYFLTLFKEIIRVYTTIM